jgi:hypothetical protein
LQHAAAHLYRERGTERPSVAAVIKALAVGVEDEVSRVLRADRSRRHEVVYLDRLA